MEKTHEVITKNMHVDLCHDRVMVVRHKESHLKAHFRASSRPFIARWAFAGARQLGQFVLTIF